MLQNWQAIVRFFRNEPTNDAGAPLSDPIPVRLTLPLVEEVTQQAKAFGGDRYRSKHLQNLIELGTKFYRVNSEYVSQLPLEHLNLVIRIHYVFNELRLKAEQVAETLGHQNVLKVSSWLNGTEIPNFSDLEQFARTYFLNGTWLKMGSTSYEPELKPFIVIRESFHDWQYALKQIMQDYQGLKVSSIKIIRSKKGAVAFSIGYGSKNQDWLVRTFYYSNLALNKRDNVGASGFNHLVDLSILCYVLYNYIKDPLIISYDIPEDEMNLINTGQLLPMNLNIWGQNKANIWYESIFDQDDTNSNGDSTYWTGATELFRELQNSSYFQQQMQELKADPEKKINSILNNKINNS